MNIRGATVYGICLGLLSGIIITLLFNLDLANAAYRTLILSISGGWMGMLLAWLYSLLQPEAEKANELAGKPRS
ncbi:MAG: hypothetical protein R8K53_06445 [Mariprofundaceae bacterium]